MTKEQLKKVAVCYVLCAVDGFSSILKEKRSILHSYPCPVVLGGVTFPHIHLKALKTDGPAFDMHSALEPSGLKKSLFFTLVGTATGAGSCG